MQSPLINTIQRAAQTVAVVLVLTACSAPAGPALSAPEAQAGVADGALTLIDIRTPGEWRQTGVAKGALRIDMRQPGGPKAFVAAVDLALGGDKTAPVALICRTGNRSNVMQGVLLGAGYTKVYNVSEGMAGSGAGPGWIRRGLPVEPCPNC
jgi:rhodanese-related sulfurtransferase